MPAVCKVAGAEERYADLPTYLQGLLPGRMLQAGVRATTSRVGCFGKVRHAVYTSLLFTSGRYLKHLQHLLCISINSNLCTPTTDHLGVQRIQH